MADSGLHHRTGGQSIRQRVRFVARWVHQHFYLPVCYAYAFLFMYTGFDKLQHVARFIHGSRKIPYAGKYAELIGWGIPVVEILLAIALVLPYSRIQRWALRLSTALMAVFTLYLTLMLLFVEKKLCHCGGVIESMGWKTHITFNLIWLIAGIYALRKLKNYKYSNPTT